jgi:hypothetical protein
MKKFSKVVLLLIVLVVIVGTFHFQIGNAIQQCGGWIYWHAGMHKTGSMIIASGVSLMDFENMITPVAELVFK